MLIRWRLGVLPRTLRSAYSTGASPLTGAFTSIPLPGRAQLWGLLAQAIKLWLGRGGGAETISSQVASPLGREKTDWGRGKKALEGCLPKCFSQTLLPQNKQKGDEYFRELENDWLLQSQAPFQLQSHCKFITSQGWRSKSCISNGDNQQRSRGSEDDRPCWWDSDMVSVLEGIVRRLLLKT